MSIKSTIIYITILFIGFAIGRIGHILGGDLNAPHHWIYGILLIIIGAVLWFYKKEWSLYFIFFGIGLTISDLKDMLDLKFYGVDDVEIKKFWGID
jgi:uncharacterized membrane protein YgaE (UPF0421/DUF939 family)